MSTAPHLAWIDTQRDRMVRLLTDWASINSGSENLAGLDAMAAALKIEFSRLGGDLREITLPPFERIDNAGRAEQVPVGKALTITKRPTAALRVLLSIHMDTVYPLAGPFQKVESLGPDKLRGPGVADAKGGLVVMLVALEAFERSPFVRQLGWEVIINPDEEISSPGSAALFVEAAGRNHLGLLFEPAMDEAGTIVSSRRGSGNFSVIVRGRSAHAGRDVAKGRNAVVAASELAVALDALGKEVDGITVNVSRIDGGGAVNVVPDLAIVRFNIRVTEPRQTEWVAQRLEKIIDPINRREGFSAKLHGGFRSPPKPVTPETQRLLDHVASCGRELGLTIQWKPSGGVSDGNRLAAAGLTNVDSLGVRGGAIHSPDEYVLLDSLTERARLTALLLTRLASGELAWR